MTTKEAVDHLIKQLNEDPQYRYSWQANIAMAFVDEWRRVSESEAHVDVHQVANAAAKNFLEMFCEMLCREVNCNA